LSKSTTTLLEEFVGLFRIGGCLNLYRLFEFSFVATECLGGHQLPIKNHCVITLHHRLHFCQDQMPRSCINSFRDLLCHSMLPVCLGGHQLPIKNRLCHYITLHQRLHFCQDQIPRSRIKSFGDLLCHSVQPVIDMILSSF